jgi:hypothetical protein
LQRNFDKAAEMLPNNFSPCTGDHFIIFMYVNGVYLIYWIGQNGPLSEAPPSWMLLLLDFFIVAFFVVVGTKTEGERRESIWVSVPLLI